FFARSRHRISSAVYQTDNRLAGPVAYWRSGNHKISSNQLLEHYLLPRIGFPQTWGQNGTDVSPSEPEPSVAPQVT
ncbi:hypothetical protein BaRGS_00028614, partial [Batillaria attramentaria]